MKNCLPGFLLLIAGLPLAFATPQSTKPWIGAAIDQGKTGVLIRQVLSGTPAEKAGLKAGDEIVAIGKKTTKSPKDLVTAIQEAGVGATIELTFLRRGKQNLTKAALEARPEQVAMLKKQLVGKPIPKNQFKMIHNQIATEGKVTVFEFWATWCPACRATHPILSEFAKQHPSIAVIAVTEEDKDEVAPYLKKIQPSFTVALDSEGETSKSWWVSAVPTFVVADKKGVIRHASIGGGSYLKKALEVAVDLSKK